MPTNQGPPDLLSQIVRQCPEFSETWNYYVAELRHLQKPRTVEGDSLRLAMFLDGSYKTKQTHFFPRLFECIESLITDNGENGRIVEQYLRMLRMSLVTRMNGGELYAKWMGPATKHLWEQAGKYVIDHCPRYASKPSSKGRPKRLRQYEVTLMECEPRDPIVPANYLELMNAHTKTKLGGEPDWVQGDMRPKYACCNQDMTFVAQIDSIESASSIGFALSPQERFAVHKDAQWTFGDAGRIYLFFCFYCQETTSVFQQ